jgi:hypothetical protein
MPATTSIPLPAAVVANWDSARRNLAEIERQHEAGGSDELLKKYAAAKKAYDEWRRPQIEFEAAKRELAEFSEHAGRNLELARGNVHLAVQPVTGPICARVRGLMNAVLQSHGTLPQHRIQEKYQALLQALRRLERIGEEPGNDIEQILGDILEASGVDVFDLMADVTALAKDKQEKPVPNTARHRML